MNKEYTKIAFNGAVCDVESYIKDGADLIYMECIGQEYMVKSVTSVLMQGRVRQNDHAVVCDKMGYFNVNKQGNKRKMMPLEDGMAHAILYHSASIKDTNFNVLIGRNDDELFASFESWLEKSQPLPYPKNLTKELFQKFKDREFLFELNTFNMKALKIKTSIFEDDYNEIQEAILETCRENGLIDPNAQPKIIKQKAPLPKSCYLTPKQVQKIFDTLDSMPKTYELEGVDIKPIGLKLFGGPITLYIVEADKGCEDDEYESMHTQCFGYIENVNDPSMSEWGYINVRDYLEIRLQHTFNNNGNMGVIDLGFEQDLYFKNKYINQSGQVGTLEELTGNRNFTCPNCSSNQVELSETVDGYHWCTCIDCNENFKIKEK